MYSYRTPFVPCSRTKEPASARDLARRWQLSAELELLRSLTAESGVRGSVVISKTTELPFATSSPHHPLSLPFVARAHPTSVVLLPHLSSRSLLVVLGSDKHSGTGWKLSNNLQLTASAPVQLNRPAALSPSKARWSSFPSLPRRTAHLSPRTTSTSSSVMLHPSRTARTSSPTQLESASPFFAAPPSSTRSGARKLRRSCGSMSCCAPTSRWEASSSASTRIATRARFASALSSLLFSRFSMVVARNGSSLDVAESSLWSCSASSTSLQTASRQALWKVSWAERVSTRRRDRADSLFAQISNRSSLSKASR